MGRRLSLDVGAGGLTVAGAPDSDVVQVRGRACAGSRDDLDDMKLHHERRGDKLTVASEVDSSGNWLFFSFDWNDGSGDIDVRDVTGDFLARDTGSGDVRYNAIGGAVQVRD